MAVTRYRDARGHFAKADGRRKLRKEVYESPTGRKIANTDLRVWGRVGIRRPVELLETPLAPEPDPGEFEPIEGESIQIEVGADEDILIAIREAIEELDLTDGDALQLQVQVDDEGTTSRAVTGEDMDEIVGDMTAGVFDDIRDATDDEEYADEP